MKFSAFLCSYGPLFDQGASIYEVIDTAAAQGFGAVEPFPREDLDTVEQARQMGQYAKDKGLAVSCFSTGCELLGPDVQEVMARMRRYIDMTAAMGCPYFHHTIHPPLVLPKAGGLSFAQAMEQALPLVKELCRYAADRGVLCIYEDQGMYFNGCVNFQRFCEAMDGTPYGVVADTGNIFFVDETPQQFIGNFSHRIVHVHLKDYLRKSGSGPCPGAGWYVSKAGEYLRDTIPGHGIVEFPAVFRLLQQIGYDGWCSLEYAAMEPISFGIPMAADNLRRYDEDIRRNPVQMPLLDSISPRFE